MSCWRPLLSVLVQVALLGVGCAVADHGGLDGPDGWPYLLGFVLLSVFYASWPLGITLLTGTVAALTREEATLRGAVVLGAVVAGASGALGVAVGLVWPVVPPAAPPSWSSAPRSSWAGSSRWRPPQRCSAPGVRPETTFTGWPSHPATCASTTGVPSARSAVEGVS